MQQHSDGTQLRAQLVAIALAWQHRFGNAPRITSDLSEYDAAMLIGCPEDHYRAQMALRSAVAKGHDFEHGGLRYQVKANRPSGRPGSTVTKVANPRFYEWDRLIWVHYFENFQIREAWIWEVGDFRKRLGGRSRLSPADLRQGTRLFPV